MARSTTLLLAGGGVAVLGLLVMLLRAVSSQPSSASPTTTPPAATAPHAEARRNVEPPAVGAAAPAPRTRASSSLPAMAGRPSRDDSPSVRPSDSDAPPAPRVDTENLHYGGTQLRTQTKAVEPAVRECVDKAVAGGLVPSGKAWLTYVVEKKGDKYVVDETGIDEDRTTLQGAPLLECLRDTARGMHFEGLPRQAKAVFVTRSVTLEEGKLVEYKHVDFSYLK